MPDWAGSQTELFWKGGRCTLLVYCSTDLVNGTGTGKTRPRYHCGGEQGHSGALAGVPNAILPPIMRSRVSLPPSPHGFARAYELSHFSCHDRCPIKSYSILQSLFGQKTTHRCRALLFVLANHALNHFQLLLERGIVQKRPCRVRFEPCVCRKHTYAFTQCLRFPETGSASRRTLP